VRLSPRGMALLRTLGLTPVDATSEPDGWTRAVLAIEAIDPAERDLLRLGAEVEVLAPAALRERLAETATRLAGLYRAASAQA
jgi:predicted DNA-binding transcriptional regulator YafY